MSNPRAWRGRGRTTTPNSRQKRNKLFLDAHPRCEGCWTVDAEHAHHVLDRTFRCRTSWHAMRAFCEQCHVNWHKAPIVTITYGRSTLRLRVDPNMRVYPVPI